MTFERNYVWKDDISLWTDNVKKSLFKPRAYHNLGLAYNHIGDMDKAISYYKKTLSLNPYDRADVYNNLGISYFYKGDVDTAIVYFKDAISLDPSHADAHYNLGIAYGEKGLEDEAYKEIRKGILLRKK